MRATKGIYRYLRTNDKNDVGMLPMFELIIDYILKSNSKSLIEITSPVSIIILAAILNLLVTTVKIYK